MIVQKEFKSREGRHIEIRRLQALIGRLDDPISSGLRARARSSVGGTFSNQGRSIVCKERAARPVGTVSTEDFRHNWGTRIGPPGSTVFS